ncbi:hypothetical protein C0J52_15871 [Blattella germanica]|nr:hypothetical protein C0J52_15871 [Blattella germanica]
MRLRKVQLEFILEIILVTCNCGPHSAAVPRTRRKLNIKTLLNILFCALKCVCCIIILFLYFLKFNLFVSNFKCLSTFSHKLPKKCNTKEFYFKL